MKNRYGFTLTELVIGITISAIVLLVVLSFISNVMSDFGRSTQKTTFITKLHDFTNKVNQYRQIHSNSVVIDNLTGHDVLFLYSTGSTGVIFGSVNVDNMLLDSLSNNPIYGAKLIGYKELTATQVTDILGDSSQAYSYDFFRDKIFDGMYIQGFNLLPYNSGSLVNLDLGVLVYYKSDLDGMNLDDLVPQDIFELTLTF